MRPLDKSFRNRLERTIREARDIAEAAAKASLEQLGVGEATPFAHLSEEEKDLRRRLRFHGRQLGDSLNGGKIQTMDRLVEEVAYEHWHQMLFARFLGENNLLMYDGVAVTLEECAELAADDGLRNEWELAARLATAMLPQIFRPDAVVFTLLFPPEHQQRLERLVAELPLEVFTASDSLGWVYQFWQAKKKDAVNASEVKIGARELPAVTQLFTEPYMVAFLLDNALGAWWVAKLAGLNDGKELRPGACQILRDADTEEELRTFFSLPGVPLEYLRFVKQADGEWRPAAGTFAGWPESLAELKTLDPCCGSGHFLVAAFLMLVAMRMALEELSAREAVDAVLRDNIHGLELDQRCVELAAFALALTAWRYPESGGYRPLPELHLACSGLAISAKKEEWLALAGNNTNLRLALEQLYMQFKDAQVLGSLINPEASLGRGSLFELEWKDVGPLLTKALAGERNDEKVEIGVVASGLLSAANLLSNKYCLVSTNVPFLGELKQEPLLREYAESINPDFKIDLAYTMLARLIDFGESDGSISVVVPMDWIVQTKNRKMRKHLFHTHDISIVAKLGRGAFDYQVGKDVMLLQLNKRIHHTNTINVIELISFTNHDDIRKLIGHVEIKFQRQSEVCVEKDYIINTGKNNAGVSLGKYCDVFRGLSTGDSNRFYRQFQEVNEIGAAWEYLRQTSSYDTEFAGMSDVIFWQKEQGELAQLAENLKDRNHAVQSWRRGKPFWGKRGISVNRMGSFRASLYLGERYSENAGAIIPKNYEHLETLWCYFSSQEFLRDLKQLTHKLDVEPRYLKLLSFDLGHWSKVAEEKYPSGLPRPYSDDPVQWIFHGHPCGSVVWDEEAKWTDHGPLRSDYKVLQVAVARLLGYRWPAELDANMELADEQRELVSRCKALLPYADDDGIVCIPPVRGEMGAADRLENLLAAAYGSEWSAAKKSELLAQADHAGKPLETWLREKFFSQHCKLFQHRPFIWHIWDGLRDGFAALVNYHKLDHKLLETLIYTYLGDWISRQKQDIGNGVDGAQEKLAAAESLKEKLELILTGEAPYDIFIRWKPLAQQPIGWNPDLNDGVRLNIRPFLSAPDVAKKGAGVLRDKPNIKWDKDRGKDVESAPWYHKFAGDRINDHHLTLVEKRAAREAIE